MNPEEEWRGEGKNDQVRLQLKKGPWTAEEDEILIQHVKKYGQGRWSAVRKYSGLARCGKSCRLRWANHLRPDLKKGSLTPEEERLILQLQEKYGNKWARIASELPGRTDNEIKNFWNSRIKRRLRDTNQNQEHQSYSSQPTTPTTSSDFQFQVLSSQLPPNMALASTSSSSLPFTVDRSPPLLSSPARFKRHRKLSSITNQTPIHATGFTASPSMNTTSFLMSPSLSPLTSPSTQSSGLLSQPGLQSSSMLSPLLSSLTHPPCPRFGGLSSLPNSPVAPQSPTLFSTLSQPSSPRLTFLARPNSPKLSSLSETNSPIAAEAGSQVLSSSGQPGSPILSLVASTSSMSIPKDNSSSTLMLNQKVSELSGTSSFLFDVMSSDASGYSYNSELPSSQLSEMSSGMTLDQNVNLAKMNSYDVLLEDPSQSDVILDLKIKAGWTRGLRKKPRLDVAPASMMNTTMLRAADELLKEYASKVNGELMKEQTRQEFTFDLGQSQAQLQNNFRLFEDMLKESQAPESSMTSGTEACLVFTNEKPFFGVQNDCINFSHLQSSAGDERKGEQALEDMSYIHKDLTKLIEFDPASLSVHELYAHWGKISNTQCSNGTTDNNFSHNLDQLAAPIPLANTYNQETNHVTCVLDNFPGVQ